VKPFDLYQHFHNFCEMLENNNISIEARLQLGREWLGSLPASILCVPYELSRDVVFAAMKGRLQDEEIKNGRGQGKAPVKAKELQGQVQTPSETPPGPEPLREDAGDGGGKTAVEDLDRPKASKAERKGARKA